MLNPRRKWGRFHVTIINSNSFLKSLVLSLLSFQNDSCKVKKICKLLVCTVHRYFLRRLDPCTVLQTPKSNAQTSWMPICQCPISVRIDILGDFACLTLHASHLKNKIGCFVRDNYIKLQFNMEKDKNSESS